MFKKKVIVQGPIQEFFNERPAACTRSHTQRIKVLLDKKLRHISRHKVSTQQGTTLQSCVAETSTLNVRIRELVSGTIRFGI